MMSRFMRVATCGDVDSDASRSVSRFRPSGVNSKTQANTKAGMKPMARTITTDLGNQDGASNIGNTVPATCVISHAATKYRPAIRMTLRRLSSAMNPMHPFRLVSDGSFWLRGYVFSDFRPASPTAQYLRFLPVYPEAPAFPATVRSSSAGTRPGTCGRFHNRHCAWLLECCAA